MQFVPCLDEDAILGSWEMILYLEKQTRCNYANHPLETYFIFDDILILLRGRKVGKVIMDKYFFLSLYTIR